MPDAQVLTDADKSRIKFHLGYMATTTAASITFGFARPIQTMFLLEDALTLVAGNPFDIGRILEIVETLDDLLRQIREQTRTLVASRTGDLDLHPLKAQGILVTDSLRKEYVEWANLLADTLGVPLYPFAKRFQRRGPGTSVRVRS